MSAAVAAPGSGALPPPAAELRDSAADACGAACGVVADDADRMAAVALSVLPECGPARLSALIADTPGAATEWWQLLAATGPGSDGPVPPAVPAKVWSVWRRAARAIDTEQVYAEATRVGWVRLSFEPDFPVALAADRERPQVLFGRGDLSRCQLTSTAIIGTRRASRYGRSVARAFGAQLASDGTAVVSGLARGIDAAAHGGVMSVDPSKAIGVVGSGLDVVYPREHRDLWEQVAAEGLLLSEAPPGSAPLPWRFPARNRIIAALADAVVVVESGESGGSLHTVEQAAQRGRPVLAVPGPVTAASSAGTNRLIADGIQPCLDASDIGIAISLAPQRPTQAPARPTQSTTTARATAGTSVTPRPAAVEQLVLVPPAATLGEDQPVAPGPEVSDEMRRVLDAVDTHGTATDTIVLSSGLAIGAVASALSRLQQLGLIAEHGGWWTLAAANSAPKRNEERCER